MTYQFRAFILFFATFALLGALSGCAAVSGYKNSELTSFVKASQGRAKGIYSMLTGSGEYCMLEIHNLPDIRVDFMDYSDGVCNIHWHRAE